MLVLIRLASYVLLAAAATGGPECRLSTPFLPVFHFVGSPQGPKFPDNANVIDTCKLLVTIAVCRMPTRYSPTAATYM